MTSSILGHGFAYAGEIRRNDGTVETLNEHNLLPQVAVDHIAGMIRGTVAPIGTWYVGLIEANFVPDSTTTSADLPAIECVSYSEGTRPEWIDSYDNVAVIDSLGDMATFTFTANKRVYGAFLVSSSAKGGGTGTLLSIARFSNPKDIDSGEVLTLGAGLTLLPTSL